MLQLVFINMTIIVDTYIPDCTYILTFFNSCNWPRIRTKYFCVISSSYILCSVKLSSPRPL